MRHVLISAVLAAMATKAAAQGETCPAPIRPGEYETFQTDAMAVVDLMEGGYGMRIVAPVGDRTDSATVSAEACDVGFAISAVSQDGIPLEWKMRLQDWEDEKGPTYGGTWKSQYVTIEMTAVLTDPSTMALRSRLTATAGGGTARAQPIAVGRHVAEGPVAPYECRCKSALQKWIDTRVENAEDMRDLFANMKYRERPDIFPPDDKSKFERKWKPSVYKQVIYTMNGLDVSFDAAAEMVARERWPEEMPTEGSATDAGGSAAEYHVPDDEEDDGTGSKTVAYTDMTSCEPSYGSDYREECFPRIERESTVTHEEVHVETCKDWKLRISEHPDLHAQADDEVKAYGAEIDFLKNWIPKNCG